MSGSTSLLSAAPAHSLTPGPSSDEASTSYGTTNNSITTSPRRHESPSTSNVHSQPSRSASSSREHGRSPVREETRRAIRRRSLDLVAEAKGDVEAFVREMDEKRKVLDDQIHKFIAQKEREYKRYEQEMRTKYRTPHSARPSASGLKSSVLASSTPDVLIDSLSAEAASASMTAPESQGAENVRSRIDRRTANSGLEDVRPSYEREKDFMGLFTPSFLPLLDGKHELNRSPSAPLLSEIRATGPPELDRSVLQRANTEPLLDSKGNKRPSFGLRTPSSGSEGLVSALKTTGAKKQSKPMRVMLQLADDQPAVHPADELPTEEGYAPVREAEAMHHSKQPEETKTQSEDSFPSPSPSPPLRPRDSDDAQAQESPVAAKRSSLTQGLTSQSSNSLNKTMPNAAFVDDLDDLASPFPLDEEVGQTQRSQSDWEVDFEEDIGLNESREFLPSPVESPQLEQSPLGMSPEPDISPSLNTSGVKIRSSSSSSGQPISPGFSRPSVSEDPIFDAASPDMINDADPVGQGSFYGSFARQSFSARNTMSGSLGESFMQRNAENLMRRRRS